MDTNFHRRGGVPAKALSRQVESTRGRLSKVNVWQQPAPKRGQQMLGAAKSRLNP